jgi:hypothetical protein
MAMLANAEKHKKHNGRFVTSRCKFVPFVQEAHNRLGREAAEILGWIANEAAQRSGGTKGEITDKRSRILVSYKSKLSTTLATDMAQHIFGFVRGSAVHGQYPCPVQGTYNEFDCTTAARILTKQRKASLQSTIAFIIDTRNRAGVTRFTRHTALPSPYS